ncbi:MAG: right-handed parallel beta-helix repeat-containing protein [Candidatus Promineofilum sp.]|nr:right-handed parallel beta-helix repeat-containing protein [Promineifilum sp.]MCW5862332.1 right-handed parallel beta-helix repeat-containing protein [Anaerolineae bacterium]
MGTTYYVSAANGNNNNPGTDPAQPLRTIQAAVNKLQAGDSVSIRGGVYAERVYIQKPGTAESPIRLAAYEGEQPVLDGVGLSIAEDAALVVIHQSQDVALSGLTIRNSSGRGLVITQSSRVTVGGCTIETCFAGGLQAIQDDKLLVEKCIIHDCARRFMAYGPGRQNVALLAQRSSDVELRENRVYENSDQGIVISVGCQRVSVTHNTCYDNRNGQIGVISAQDVTIDANLCYHTGRAEYLNLMGRRGPGITKGDLALYRDGGAWHSRNVQVSNNIVVGCGVGFQTGQAGGRLSDLRLAHNTILNSTGAAIHIGRGQTGRRSYIENNLIVSSNSDETVLATTGLGIVWRHNLWSSYPGQGAYNPASDVIEAEAGLVNVTAPIAPGAVTSDPYKLIEGSVAINRGIRHNGDTPVDFWGTPRDRKPDLGAYEFQGTAGDVPDDDIELPPAGTRVTKDLQALYDFKEGQGQQVRDVGSVGEPLHLRIVDAANVSWQSDGLRVTAPTLITSERPARKVIDACRASKEVTLEVWIQPANVSQDGPARIVSISASKTERNVTLGQGLYGNYAPDVYMTRLRATSTSTNGLPAVVSPAGTATTELTHVVYTRRADGRATLYVNGQDRGVLNIEGDLSNWDDRMPLLLANELSNDRPWLGVFRLTAVYSRALAAAEVVHNYEAGAGGESAIVVEFGLLSGSAYGVAPHKVEFDASSSTAVAGIAGYFWEFGDGQTSDRPNPSYIYPVPGIYTVTLAITDTAGNTAKVTKEGFIVVVTSPVPPLPSEFARFVLVDVTNSTVLGFGLQYPDLRCTVSWNQDPYYLLTFSVLDDVRQSCEREQVKLVWVDALEVA